MNSNSLRKITGALFIVGALIVNVPYTLLIINFEYPDVLRQPTGVILTKFAAGGDPLVWTWLAFAWTGLPLLVGILLLTPALFDGDSGRPDYLARTGMYFGAVGALAQILGLLRWPFVVSILAERYTDPAVSLAAKEALEAVFQAVHQYGGVVLGEHIGQAFSIAWMVLISFGLLRRREFPRWLGWSGFIASSVYLLAQGELLATAMPALPYWSEAGLVGSMMWLAWMVALGISLIRSTRSGYEHARQNSGLGLNPVQ